MFVRGMTLWLTAVIGLGWFGVAAGAQQSKPATPPPDASSSGPPVLRHIPGLRLLFGDYESPDEEAATRAAKSQDIDESYYEPQPAPPRGQKKKTTAVSPQKPPATATAPAATKAATAPKAAASLSCEKAAAVISGYGFANVAPTNCAGKTYAFTAMRDGKSFAIKLDSASGELSEVKKLP